jgi:hypothetical protein
MLNQSNMKIDIALTLSALLLRQATGSTLIIHSDRFKFVSALPSVGIWISVTFSAQIKIGTGVAVMTITRSYLSGTGKALLHKFGSLTVLQMPQHHH